MGANHRVRRWRRSAAGSGRAATSKRRPIAASTTSTQQRADRGAIGSQRSASAVHGAVIGGALVPRASRSAAGVRLVLDAVDERRAELVRVARRDDHSAVLDGDERQRRLIGRGGEEAQAAEAADAGRADADARPARHARAWRGPPGAGRYRCPGWRGRAPRPCDPASRCAGRCRSGRTPGGGRRSPTPADRSERGRAAQPERTARA